MGRDADFDFSGRTYKDGSPVYRICDCCGKCPEHCDCEDPCPFDDHGFRDQPKKCPKCEVVG